MTEKQDNEKLNEEIWKNAFEKENMSDTWKETAFFCMNKARQQERKKIINEIEEMKVINEYYGEGLSWNEVIDKILNQLKNSEAKK